MSVMLLEEKKCWKCKQPKPVEEFHRNKFKKDGYAAECKKCNRKIRKEYYKRNSEKIREKSREWITKYPKRNREKVREWQKKYPEKVREKSRKWKKENPQIAGKWYRENSQRAKEMAEKRSNMNKENWRIYFRAKYGENPTCQICGKTLNYFTGKNAISVCWDHKNGGEEIIKIIPSNWLRGRFPTPINIKIWESCGFGMLCSNCNLRLKTLNRLESLKGGLSWHIRALEYSLGDKDHSFAIQIVPA